MADYSGGTLIKPISPANSSKAPPHTRLKFDGVAVVRQFLDADDLKSLAQLAETTYKLMSLAQIPDAEMADNFKRWNGVWLQPLPDFLNKSGSNSLVDVYGRLVSTISQRTRHLFGYAWRFYPQRSFMRRQVGGATVPWHIDADAAGIGRSQSINVWLPLDTVGSRLPSLDVIPASHKKMRTLALMRDRVYRDDTFAASFGSTVTPILDPGDALVFDQFTLHRTQHSAASDFTRTSCEFRFIKMPMWRRSFWTKS